MFLLVNVQHISIQTIYVTRLHSLRNHMWSYICQLYSHTVPYSDSLLLINFRWRISWHAVTRGVYIVCVWEPVYIVKPETKNEKPLERCLRLWWQAVNQHDFDFLWSWSCPVPLLDKDIHSLSCHSVVSSHWRLISLETLSFNVVTLDSATVRLESMQTFYVAALC